MAKINLTVNGVARALELDPEMPLRWALRDQLNLVGTKFGCGAGYCGACTVHINGEARRSCSVSVATAAGKNITTIEGLSRDGRHPLQLAWVETDAPQCGYCQAGQLMAAASLLAKNNNPSDAEIQQAMSGNLCRCGTYLRIRQAVRRAVEINRSKR